MPGCRRFGILGGGIAGLSLSYFLDDEDCDILEKSQHYGGLCRSFSQDGFTYDLGGHVIFSKDKEILDLQISMLGENVKEHLRRNSIWFKKRFVKYPFENGLAALDKQDIFDCLYHFVYNPQRPLHNFEDWIYNTFGSGIADNYLLPYNRKIWKTDPATMATDWVERIPKPPVEDVFKSALGIETEGYVHQLHFSYPKQAGFQSLPAAFLAASKATFVPNFAVQSIRKSPRGWLVSDDSAEREYNRIVCTMPIFTLIEAIAEVPDDVRAAARSLKFNSLIVVMIGVDSADLRDRFGVYVPQPDAIFHRLCFYGYFGDNYAPPGKSSVIAEITANTGDEIWGMSDEQLTARVIADLAREQFIDPAKVVSQAVQRTEHAYVIYDADRTRNLDLVKAYCAQEGIELCGRFAEFHYVNSDAVIRSAKTLAERLKARRTA